MGCFLRRLLRLRRSHLLPTLPRVKALSAILFWANPAVLKAFLAATVFVPLSPRHVNDLLAIALLPASVKRRALVEALRSGPSQAGGALDVDLVVKSLFDAASLAATVAFGDSTATTEESHGLSDSAAAMCCNQLINLLDENQDDSWRVGASYKVPSDTVKEAIGRPLRRASIRPDTRGGESAAGGSDDDEDDEEDTAGKHVAQQERASILHLPVALPSRPDQAVILTLPLTSAFQMALVLSGALHITETIAKHTAVDDVVDLIVDWPPLPPMMDEDGIIIDDDPDLATSRRATRRKSIAGILGVTSLELQVAWREAADGKTFFDAVGASTMQGAATAKLVAAVSRYVFASHIKRHGLPTADIDPDDILPVFDAASTAAACLHSGNAYLALAVCLPAPEPPVVPLYGASRVHVVRSPAVPRHRFIDAVRVADALEAIGFETASRIAKNRERAMMMSDLAASFGGSATISQQGLRPMDFHGWQRATVVCLIRRGASLPVVEWAATAAQVPLDAMLPYALVAGRADVVERILVQTTVVSVDSAFAVALCPDSSLVERMAGRFTAIVSSDCIARVHASMAIVIDKSIADIKRAVAHPQGTGDDADSEARHSTADDAIVAYDARLQQEAADLVAASAFNNTGSERLARHSLNTILRSDTRRFSTIYGGDASKSVRFGGSLSLPDGASASSSPTGVAGLPLVQMLRRRSSGSGTGSMMSSPGASRRSTLQGSRRMTFNDSAMAIMASRARATRKLSDGSVNGGTAPKTSSGTSRTRVVEDHHAQ
jgi:hypothetical protein